MKQIEKIIQRATVSQEINSQEVLFCDIHFLLRRPKVLQGGVTYVAVADFKKHEARVITWQEVLCYKALYGNLIECVPHYCYATEK